MEIEITGIRIKLPDWNWWQYLLLIIALILIYKGELKLLIELIKAYLYQKADGLLKIDLLRKGGTRKKKKRVKKVS